MLTTAYALKGKDVPSELAGQEITIKVPENYTEAETFTKAGQSDVVAKFADGYVIALQSRLRTAAGKKDKDGKLVNDVAALQKLADEYKYSVQAEGTPKTIKPQTKQQRTEQGVGNRLFERMASDEKFRNQMLKNGVAEQAEFDAWFEAKQAAEAAKTPAATTETGASEQTQG